MQVVLTLLLLACAAAASVTAFGGFEQATFLGRAYWDNSTSLRPGFPVGSFDWSGTATGIYIPSEASFYPLDSVSITLAARGSDNGPLNQPHVFSVFVWRGVELDVVPPLDPWLTATSIHNFSTEEWTHNVSQNASQVVEVVRTVPLYTGGNKNQSVLVWVIKETEADWNRRSYNFNFLTFVSFVVKANLSNTLAEREVLVAQQIRFLQQQQQSGPLLSGLRYQPPPTSQRRLLFIGDSITAGYCNIMPENGTNSFRTERYTATWSFRAASQLRAAYQTVCWSGMGMLINCCGNESAAAHGNLTMSRNAIYRSVATNSNPAWQWDYTTGGETPHTEAFVPDAVWINLGTNDETNFGNMSDKNVTHPLVANFTERYLETIGVLARQMDVARRRAGLSGKQKLFVNCGPMSHSTVCPIIKDVFEKITSTYGSLLETFFVEFDTLADNQTSCGHPSVANGGEQHLADIVVKALKKHVFN
jgi:hypothetical protein